MKKFDYREELRLIGMPAGMGLCLASIETVLDAMTTSTTSHEEILYITTEMTLDEVKEQMLEEAVKLVSGINISDAECSGLTLADKIKIDMVQQWFMRHTTLPTFVSYQQELTPSFLMNMYFKYKPDILIVDRIPYVNGLDEVIQEISNRGCTGHIGYQLPCDKEITPNSK
ncbi:MAG: hypothetical protein [Bacteriophage sp.]|nr:MAG: hypothetical protein [Bacteriophage sp.]